ncbi:CDGSH iron-sulfur domain-containing protein [Kitasatospora sp. NPDC048538]|uniref:CDGSH iron-sulfur domain-containing protein n=1 Tax=unclassified Kitasatospora TaxID=2633591 RepID=UPI0033F16BBC
MSAGTDREAVRVVVVPGGPLLVEGPVEVVLPDGTVRVSERPVVALCACRRSRTYPFCDTSHRRHRRPDRDPAADGGGGGSAAGGGRAGQGGRVGQVGQVGQG